MNWMTSETNDRGFMAYRGGYMLTVYPAPNGPADWFWAVYATDEISEWPEVYATGFAKNSYKAKAEAKAAVARALSRRP